MKTPEEKMEELKLLALHKLIKEDFSETEITAMLVSTLMILAKNDDKQVITYLTRMKEQFGGFQETLAKISKETKSQYEVH